MRFHQGFVGNVMGGKRLTLAALGQNHASGLHRRGILPASITVARTQCNGHRLVDSYDLALDPAGMLKSEFFVLLS
jgi:hypothetical protein